LRSVSNRNSALALVLKRFPDAKRRPLSLENAPSVVFESPPIGLLEFRIDPRRENVLEGLWYVAGRFPFHSATLVSVPAVAVVLTLIGGLNLYRSLWTSLSMADPISATLSVLLALVVATYSLLAT